MPMRITFELSDKDLEHFHNVMHVAQQNCGGLGQSKIIKAARELLGKVGQAEVPEYIANRLAHLNTMISMVEDSGWQLPDEECRRVLSALAYFSEADDLIPDHIPGLGFLDDAIMVELVVRALKHEMQAYADFCAHRNAETGRKGVQAGAAVDRGKFLDSRRKQLHSRMRRRRRSERGTASTGRGTGFSLW